MWRLVSVSFPGHLQGVKNIVTSLETDVRNLDVGYYFNFIHKVCEGNAF